MKKKISILLIIVTMLSYGVYWIFFDMGHLPKGTLVSESISPNGDYILKLYVIEPSLSASAIRGELSYSKVNKNPRNIYWGYRESIGKIKWTDNYTAVINDRHLNVLHDSYDWRREFIKSEIKSKLFTP